MNPIVFALRRPMTVMVGVVAIALTCGLALTRIPVDIFPNLNLPVVYVAQPYGGMDPAQMEGLLTNYYEYHFLYINGIHHVESKNIQGLALMKLFFHPGTDMAQAMAETIGYVQRSRAFMPPGTVSPFVTRFDAGSIPVGYLVMSSTTRSIGEIQDQALFKVRPMFAGLPGVSAPPPFGGSQRTVVVRIDPDRLKAYGLSPDGVINAIAEGNAISPSGNVRIGDSMPIVPINSLVGQAKELEEIAVKTTADGVVYLGDVATVADASDLTTGYALVNGRRAVYILVTKRADSSTLTVVNALKAALPSMQAVLPGDIQVSFEFDQSSTVTRAVSSLLTEGLLGAILTGLMIMLFLRDWRTVIVVVLNIPLALAGSVVALWLTGQTINLMTLGGLALAVGILVDESTVEVENIHAKLGLGRSVARAVREGNLDTAVPRLLAMLCVIAVFLPALFMTGPARSLFVPLSLSVGFAMVSSYILSSTFVPVVSSWLLREGNGTHLRPSRSGPGEAYRQIARSIARFRWLVVPSYFAVTFAVILILGPRLPLAIFPSVDSGRFQLRLKAPAGTRIEATETIAKSVLAIINNEVGNDSVDVSVGYIGLIPATYPINAIFQWTAGPEEAMIRVALKPDTKRAIGPLKARLRQLIAEQFPTVRTSFEPADIVSEVMSFGSPTPIEVAVSGPSLHDSRAHAEKIRLELAKLNSLRDVQYAQALDYPTVNIKVDRRLAGQVGVTTAEVARSVVAATSSSRFVTPLYWPDPKTGIGYQIQVEIPQSAMNSSTAVESIPVQNKDGRSLFVRDLATVTSGTMPGEIDRYNMKRAVTITANLAGDDLGRAASDVSRAIVLAGTAPKGVLIDIRGQVAPLNELIRGLGLGLVLAVVVILLLLTANFQSIKLALVVTSTAPAAIAGVILALTVSQSSLNLQSFNGAIMSVGVAVANAILLVTFAERSRLAGASAVKAAAEGAAGRVRPILMTAMAMISGMLPLALGMGESGEQAAPLGLAVVGGLAAATLATLFALPAVFALIQGRSSRSSASLDPDDPASLRFDHLTPSANGETQHTLYTIG